MRTSFLSLSLLVLVAHAVGAESNGADLPAGDSIGRWLDPLGQLFLWAQPFEDDALNYTLNLFLGAAEALVGTILISHGQRQIDFVGSSDEEGLRRVARRTGGEIVESLLGHALRIAGVGRVAVGIFLGVAGLF